jgi:hypothetical protein
LGANVIVALLVLGAFLLSISALVLSFIPQRRVPALDESGIDTAAALNDAMAIQRSMRIAVLQQRMSDRSNWSYALLGLAFLLQMAALAVDHFTHLSIAGIGVLPACFFVSTFRASRRRDAQRQLDTYVRSEPSPPLA